MFDYRTFCVSFFLLIGFALSGQDEEPVQPNASPYHAIYNHLYYLQPESYDPYLAARSLDPVDPESKEESAIKLKEILDGRGMYIDLNRLPDNSNYYDSTQRGNIYVLSKIEPRIYVEKLGDGWVYSRTTIEEIDRMYKEIYPLDGALRSLFRSPQWHAKLFGIKYWQWLSSILMIGLAILAYYIIYFLLRAVGHRLAHIKRSDADMISGSISKLTRLSGLLLTLILLEIFIPALHLPPRLNAFVVKGLEILHIFFVILIISEIAHLIFFLFKEVGRDDRKCHGRSTHALAFKACRYHYLDDWYHLYSGLSGDQCHGLIGGNFDRRTGNSTGRPGYGEEFFWFGHDLFGQALSNR